ncbi:MAG: hypothetical protein ACYC66_16110, partial [Chloroflexota bacterium]
MLFYADRQHRLDPIEVTSRVVEAVARGADSFRRRSRSPHFWALGFHPELVGATVAFGELHQAVADRLNPVRDEVSPELDALVSAAILLGRCVYRSSRLLAEPPADSGLAELLAAAAAAVADAGRVAGREPLQARVPEGYAFYSLYPEMYLASADKALRCLARQRSFTVLGIRSIGASLAPTVAGALVERGLAARVATLRPRGHPFDRYVELGPAMAERLSADAEAGSGFLVVDEGPGLTCSSFLSVCSALDRLGVQQENVALLSAWRGAPSIYASEENRQRWKRVQLFHTDAAEAFDGWRGLLPFVEAALRPASTVPDGHDGGAQPLIQDLSYGRWRERCYPSVDLWPTVHRPTERTKLLIDIPLP